MPSQLHEAILLLFRNRPTLAPELMREALHCELPAYTEARIDSADLTEVAPAEYHADLVVLLLDGVPVYGIVVEAQRSPDRRKKFVWPVYATSLRARLELPVSLLVIAADEGVARWAAKPIELGDGSVFRPLVLGPSGVPAVVDEAGAQAQPELAVFSAIAHGRDEDVSLAAHIARAAHSATLVLDAERGRMYFDLVLKSLSDAAQRELRAMDPAKYEYQSDFAKRYIGLGRAEGRAALLQRLLARRFGALPAEATERLSTATIDELDAIGERLLSAATLEEALGSPPSRP
jgi:hypothetical protein